jgi:NHLM bacteriocin system ABC transporter ATP-binding protein
MHNSGDGFGAAIALNAAAPLRLDALGAAAVVAHGPADVFAAETGADGALGVRRHLLRLAEGQAVFPVSASPDLALVLVGGLDAALRPLREGDDPQALREGWIAALARAVFGPAAGWPEGTAPHMLAPGEPLRAAAASWVVVEAGRLEAPGLVLSAGDPPAPLAGGLSLIAAEPTQVRFVSPPPFEAGRVGLEGFHRSVLAALDRAAALREVVAADRLQERAKTNLGAMSDALEGLAATVGSLRASSSPSLPRTPLVGAFALVAEALGATLRSAPPPWAAREVAALAHFAGLGCRSVMLREDWHRRRHGPLLGQWHESGRPIALLPSRPGRYVAIDPQQGTRTDVDTQVAAAISPSATMLYAPLPDAVDGVVSLLSLGLAGVRGDLARLVAAGLAGGALASVAPVAAGLMFETAIPDGDRGAILALVAGLIAAAVGAGVFDLVKGIALLRIETRLEARLQPALMQRLLALTPCFFRDYNTGDLHDRLQALPRARRLLAGATLTSALSLALTLPSVVVIAVYGGALAWLALVLVATGVIGVALSALGEWRPRREAARIGGRETALLVQLLQGIAKLRVSASEPRMFALWAGLFSARKRAVVRASIWADARATFIATFPILALAVLFLTAFARTGPGGDLTLGGFAAINAAFAQLMAALGATSSALTSLVETTPLLERMRPILSAEPETRGLKTDPGPLVGDIEVSNVTFRYAPNAPDVIDAVSLRIKQGEFVALVGPSGSGKSTLLRLLLGFETPTSGDIFYQDHPIASLDLTALRRRIGVVLQNGRTLSGNIFENMTNGAPYSLDDAWEAVRMAGLEDDIKALPMGMHTQLTEGSPALSGGQAQRLMIARALIGKPDVLMFDEATSALDNPSQAVVTASLERLGVTRLVIAHRLSTVEHADRIIVLDKGRIVEEGGFKQLMARGGALAALARRQQL